MAPEQATCEQCEFCEFVAGGEEAEIDSEDSETLAFLPLDPAGLDHTLVIPIRHIPFLWELPDDLTSRVVGTVTKVAVALNEVVEPDGMNLINSSGEAATQTILHMHLVPRWAGDHMGEIWPRPVSGVKLLEARRRSPFRNYLASTASPA